MKMRRWEYDREKRKAHDGNNWWNKKKWELVNFHPNFENLIFKFSTSIRKKKSKRHEEKWEKYEN